MSLEIKSKNGLEFIPFEFAPQELKLDLEIALMTTPLSEITVTRLDTPTVRVCKVCEYAHEGLYCTNCFTGERVRLGKTKFAKVMKVTPNTCKNSRRVA